MSKDFPALMAVIRRGIPFGLKVALRSEALRMHIRNSLKRECHNNAQVDCVKFPLPDLDFAYLCNANLINEIRQNIYSRKGVGDIDKVVSLYETWKASGFSDNNVKINLINEAKHIPNRSHSQLLNYGEIPAVVSVYGCKKQFNFKPKEFQHLAEALDSLRTKELGIVTGSRSYYLKGVLADLEDALIKYVVNFLIKKKFRVVSVPDLLHPSVIEGCGMNVKGDRTQVSVITHHDHDL